MKSMTGYGRGVAPLGGGTVVVEIRSLNHRYLDVRARASQEIAEHATWLEQLARQKLSRGRYDVSARAEGAVTPEPQLSLSRAKSLYRQLCELSAELGVPEPKNVEWLTALPEVLERPNLSQAAPARHALEQAMTQALTDLDAMRLAEGGALDADFRERLGRIRALLDQLAARTPQLVEEYRSRLGSRLERLLASQPAALDPSRLELEVALLADKSDVNEELVRLGSHLEQFEGFLAQEEAVGRRLDFLLQEIGREVNTVGSKCQDVAVAHTVVDLKAEVERLREQVQNVE